MFELALYTMFQQSPWPNDRPFLSLDGRKQEFGPHCSTAAFLFQLEPIVVEVAEKAKWDRNSATYTAGVAPNTFKSNLKRLEITAQSVDGEKLPVPLIFFETDSYFVPPTETPRIVSQFSFIWYRLPLPAGRYLVLGRKSFGGNDYFNFQPVSKFVNKNGVLIQKLEETPGSLQLWRTPSSSSKEVAVFAMYPTTRQSAPPVRGLLSSLVRLVDEAKSDEEMVYYARLFLRCWFNPEDNEFEDNRQYDDQVRDAGVLAGSLAMATSNLKKKALLASCAVRLGRKDLWRTAVEAHFGLKVRNPEWRAETTFLAGWLYPGPREVRSNKDGRGRFILEQCLRLPTSDGDSDSLAAMLSDDWQEDMMDPAREFVSRIDYSSSRPIGKRYNWNNILSRLATCQKIKRDGKTNDQMFEALKQKLGL